MFKIVVKPQKLVAIILLEDKQHWMKEGALDLIVQSLDNFITYKIVDQNAKSMAIRLPVDNNLTLGETCNV